MDRKGTNILEGEASESDEEISDYHGFVQNTMVTEPKTEAKSDGPSSSVVVSGEASESDDDIGEYIGRNFPSLQDQTGPTLEEEYSVSIETKKPRFESPFHKKIWERNFAFRLGIVQMQLEKFNHVTGRLESFIPLANRSQVHMQDALKQYRNISETTKHLNETFESVLHQADLPDLNVSVSLD
ncbi:uncharacterized protein LOC130645833 [Hydractinia symbiolongicarpus]|uniref:uncharacterized protein LOC130645833 n=1 Tax=Hydractinia symbiolongicarpus TaxID=13093 RepID=UPI00254D721B|nr:uncharacterized protein LOC130645833 [Hydractinia symbiolongicarpus]